MYKDHYEDENEEDDNEELGDEILNEGWHVAEEHVIKENKKVVLYAEPDCDSKYIVTIRAGMKATIVFTKAE